MASAPRSLKRQVVGAHYGLRDWLVQRLTAAIMAVYTVIFLGCLLAAKDFSYLQWVHIFARAWMKLATFVTLLALFTHAWVGMRDIWMDYIKPTGLRLALQTFTITALLAYAGYAVQILFL